MEAEKGHTAHFCPKIPWGVETWPWPLLNYYSVACNGQLLWGTTCPVCALLTFLIFISSLINMGECSSSTSSFILQSRQQSYIRTQQCWNKAHTLKTTVSLFQILIYLFVLVWHLQWLNPGKQHLVLFFLIKNPIHPLATYMHYFSFSFYLWVCTEGGQYMSWVHYRLY